VGYSWARAARATHLRELGELDLVDGHIGRIVALLSELNGRQVGMVEDHFDKLRAEGRVVSVNVCTQRGWVSRHTGSCAHTVITVTVARW
jgi:hypothetical protein